MSSGHREGSRSLTFAQTAAVRRSLESIGIQQRRTQLGGYRNPYDYHIPEYALGDMHAPVSLPSYSGLLPGLGAVTPTPSQPDASASVHKTSSSSHQEHETTVVETNAANPLAEVSFTLASVGHKISLIH